MSIRRTATLLVVAFVTIVGVLGCPKKPPTVPTLTGPDSVWQGVNAVFKATATCKEDIRYVFDWGDAIDTTGATASGTEASKGHMWSAAGNVDIKVKALNSADLTKESEWSDPKTVVVRPNAAPTIDSIECTPYTSIDGIVELKVWARDPDGDSIRFSVTWKTAKTDSSLTWLPSPAVDSFSYSYTKAETVWVKVTAKDRKTAVSAPESVQVVIGQAGGVVWYWWNPEESPPTTTPVIVFDGTDSLVCVGVEDDYTFASIKINSRRFGTRKKTIQSRYTGSEDEFTFPGHPAYCNQSGNIITACEEGEIYALKPNNLSRSWRWPDSSLEGLTEEELGPAAISGNKLYIPSGDFTRIYRIDDLATNPTPPVTYNLTAGIIDAPVVDANGNVVFATDSGYLYSLNAALTTMNWRIALQPSGEVYGPVIGSGGYIFCGGDQAKLYKVDPTTQTFTSVALNGVGKRPAIGPDKIFIGTDRNTFYAFDFSLNLVWQKTVADQISTTPIVCTGGIVYVQTEDDRLYCFQQETGTQLWVCNMPDILPGSRARRMSINDEIQPSPTIAANGNIICVGERAMYCVKGYEDKGLDASAPWPKWQKNIHNAGK